jgi:AmmeMemoRadiSam system protein A
MDAPRLNQEERRTLLRLARRAIEFHLQSGSTPQRDQLGLESMSAPLEEPRGAFVTLEAAGALRGCIGLVRPRGVLWKAVVESAILAASEDPRFPVVAEEEVPGLQIEVSVLDALEPVEGPEEIGVGTHGVLVETENRRGILLPQVATERGWDSETFLQETCHKAGLRRDAWRQPSCDVYRFSAEHFSEKSEGGSG